MSSYGYARFAIGKLTRINHRKSRSLIEIALDSNPTPPLSRLRDWHMHHLFARPAALLIHRYGMSCRRLFAPARWSFEAVSRLPDISGTRPESAGWSAIRRSRRLCWCAAEESRNRGVAGV